MLCASARLSGHPVGIVANRRGFLGKRIGGIVYAESARKVAYFVEMAERAGTPLIYVQDVSGFMVGGEAESGGIIRAGAEMVGVDGLRHGAEDRVDRQFTPAARVYYAMAGQGFDPHFTFCWPTARIGVMEGESAVVALHSAEIERVKSSGEAMPEDLQEGHGTHAGRL